MNAVSGAGAGRLVATVVSAALGALSLLVCLAVIVLTDDLSTAAGPTGPPGLSGAQGGLAPGAAGGDDGSSSRPAAPDIASCTEKECPALGPPDVPVGQIPFPPGSTAATWDSELCDAEVAQFTGVRQVRMSLTQVRDFYLNNLLAAGYGWGQYGPLHANPFTKDDAGNEVVLGWDGPLTTQDPARSGQLAIERTLDGRELCGPELGFVLIKFVLP